jgi:hypothetical protein
VPHHDPRRFHFPGHARIPAWAWLLAIALHLPLALFLLNRTTAAPLVMLGATGLASQDSPRRVELPRLAPARAGARPLTAHPSPPAAVAPREPDATAAPIVVAMAAPIAVDSPPPPSTGLQPRYGDGRLWVRPLTESPRSIARALTGKTDKELTDSAVAAMVQVYLDAMAREQAGHPSAPPSWTTTIGGKTVGLDSKWIYLGPIKVPTALLALLPITVSGNMSNYQYQQQLQLMRSDLFEAARRAATYDDFKQAVKELRAQTEQQREFRKNQRTPPDTSHSG